MIERNGINVIDESERKGRPRDLFCRGAPRTSRSSDMSYAAFVLYFGLSYRGVVRLTAGSILSFLLVGFVSVAESVALPP